MTPRCKQDIIWIVVDGIRPDKLRSCGNLNRPSLFLDEILLKGSLFTTVISSGANTKTAMFAIFTSLYPSINKMDSYNFRLIKKLDPLAITITDILKLSGYKTFRYQDKINIVDMVDIDQYSPSSGFDVWESSGYRSIGETPKHSYSTKKRNNFIKKFNKSSGPKFAYIHLLASHDLNVEVLLERQKIQGGYSQTSEAYEKVLVEISKDFKDVWDKLQYTDNTLIVVSTDHGARLDVSDIYQEEQKYGMRLKDISMNTFCSFIGSKMPSQVINRMVRTIDIVPTILDITGCPPILGQGMSLLPLINGAKFSQIFAYMEAGGIYEKPPSPDKSNVWGLRTEKWKYWKHAWRGEWLINLEKDPEEDVNLIGRGYPEEHIFRKMVKDELIENKLNLDQIYSENAKRIGISQYLTKQSITPEVSLFIIVQKNARNLQKTIDSVLGQICVYLEVTIVDFTCTGRIKTIFEKYKDFRIKYKQISSNRPLISYINESQGDYISLISPETFYAPHFLYELRKKLQENSEIALIYSNYQKIDQVGLKNVIQAEKEFSKKKFIGFCFLIRKEMIKYPSDLNLKTFDDGNVLLPLVETSLIVHSPQILGKVQYKVGIFRMGIHFLLINIRNLVKARREGGWMLVMKRGLELMQKKVIQLKKTNLPHK
ncbi:MAG: sulfatase-like hydrolase/transferase [Candidatus Hodarchaeota archaeon]